MRTLNGKNGVSIHGLDFDVAGRFLRTARLKDEYYVAAGDPARFVDALRAEQVDIVSFVQELHDCEPRHAYAMRPDEMAVLRLSTYEHWFDKQIKFKPRNRLRKAWKSGIETRVLPFDDELLAGIMAIYNESPLRQGKRNYHFGKAFETVKREHATFLDRSEFIGAYLGAEMVGFAKVTHAPHYSIIMNIVAKVAHRDKAPMNALIAKSVELVAARNIPLLNYGVWGRRGLNEFKVVNAFERLEVPRYHVALTPKGQIALRLGLHRSLKERLPEAWLVKAASLRGRWNEWRYEKLGALRHGWRAPLKPDATLNGEP
jgi:hypothetical protein